MALFGCDRNSALLVASTNGCCCEVIREVFFWRFHAILIRLSYSDHVAYISFIFLLPSLLPFAMKPMLSLLDEKFPLSEFKCQNSNNNNADDTMKEKEKCQETEGKMSYGNFFKGKFSVTKLLCCHVDGEKLCVPYFHSRNERRKSFCHFRHYLLIYHYK